MRRPSETTAGLLAVVAVVFIVYGPTLLFDFTYLDDDKLILRDQRLLRDPATVWRAFQRDVFGNGSPAYRPVLTLSLMLDARLSGQTALGYHVTNVVVHALASACVVLFLGTLGYARGPSTIAAVVFAVHPVLTSAVAWIPGRNDSLLGLFVLTAWVAFVHHVRSGAWTAYAASVGLFAAALFTKETALVLPALSLLYLALFARDRLAARRASVIATAWLATIAVWWLLRAAALAGGRAGVVSFDALVANARVILDLAGAIVLPFDRPVLPTFSTRATVIGLFAALLLAATVPLVPRDRRTSVLFGCAWFTGFLLPTLVLRDPLIWFDYLEHRAWLPLVGLAIVGLEVAGRVRVPGGDRVARWLAIAAILGLAALGGWHARHFRNGLTFWTAAVNAAPESAEAHHSLGYVLQSRGDVAGAQLAYLTAVELRPSDPEAAARYYVNLGAIYETKGMLAAAARQYETAIALAPTQAPPHLNLGIIHFQTGQLNEAEAEFLQALALDPDISTTHVNMCAVRLTQRRLAAAERFCGRALELEPDSARGLIALTLVYYHQGRLREARAGLEELRARGIAVERVLPDVVAGLRRRLQ